MKPDLPASDELKNAFVDRELAQPERRAMHANALSDAALRRDLCELNTLKELVRDAYQGVPPRPRADTVRRRGPTKVAALAIVCVAIGWIAHAGFSGTAGAGDEAQIVRSDGSGNALHAASARSEKVLLHVSTRDPEDLRAALSGAESLLAGAARESRPVQVEIVANSAGIDLFRAGVSPLASEIADLKARYPALLLVACNQTMERLRERGETVALLPGVGVASSALDEIVARLQKGWIYLRT